LKDLLELPHPVLDAGSEFSLKLLGLHLRAVDRKNRNVPHPRDVELGVRIAQPTPDGVSGYRENDGPASAMSQT